MDVLTFTSSMMLSTLQKKANFLRFSSPIGTSDRVTIISGYIPISRKRAVAYCVGLVLISRAAFM